MKLVIKMPNLKDLMEARHQRMIDGNQLRYAVRSIVQGGNQSQTDSARIVRKMSDEQVNDSFFFMRHILADAGLLPQTK